MNIYQTSCIICRKQFSTKGLFSHYSLSHTEHKHTRSTGKGTQKYQLRCSCVICKLELSVQNLEAHNKTHAAVHNTCVLCGNATKSKFCSHSCAAKYNNAQRDYRTFKPGPESKTNTVKPRYTKETRQQKSNCLSTCVVCSKTFSGVRKACTEECRAILFQRAGKKSASVSIRRSKDEIALYELCADYFSHVTHNDPVFNGWDADILIHDTKTAILWNGPWHYKQLNIKNHSLKQVQNRDQIKQKEIESAGWTCLIFEDREYTPEEAFKVLCSDPWIRTKNNEL